MDVTGISSGNVFTYVNPYLYESRINRYSSFADDKQFTDNKSNSVEGKYNSADGNVNSINGNKQSDSSDKEKNQKIEKLKKRDAEVRRHEQAHLSAAGQYAKGGANFEYTTGPDGRRYASGGEVSIDMSKVPNDPQATIIKAQIIKRAALAPTEPSPQDRRVAAEATKMEMEAQQELIKKQTQGNSGHNTGNTSGDTYEYTGKTSGYNKEGIKVSSKPPALFLNTYI